jgi:Fic family protein
MRVTAAPSASRSRREWRSQRTNFTLQGVGFPTQTSGLGGRLFSNYCNQTRAEYYRQLDLASKSGGDIVPFIGCAVRGFVDGLREQLEKIWTQQWDVVWWNFVHERFQSRNSPAETRQRHLSLDLGDRGDWIEVGKVTELTPRLAKAYAGKATKTVQRDLNALVEMGLMARDGRKVRARREVILAFLPLRKEPDAPAKP